jgi:hypothetical protein
MDMGAPEPVLSEAEGSRIPDPGEHEPDRRQVAHASCGLCPVHRVLCDERALGFYTPGRGKSQ